MSDVDQGGLIRVPHPDPTRLRVVYRSYGGENRKPRPTFYDKRRALLSLIRATESVDAPVDLVFYNDGPIPADRRTLMEAHGEVVPVVGGSNRRSYRAVVAREAPRADDGDLIWFAEDDYLYRPEALAALVAGARGLPRADYFTLQGSEAIDPRRPRSRPDPRPEPGAAGDPAAVVLDGVTWYRARAATSTFGVRGRVLREDAHLLRWAPFTGGAWDTATCLTYQGLAPFRAHEIAADLRRARPRTVARAAARVGLTARSRRRPSRRRVLVGSDPELVRHLEVPEESPRTPPSAGTARIDWPAVTRDVDAWAAGRE